MNRELNLKIKENIYKVEFPNVGKFIDVETRKAELSGDKYLSLLKIGTFSSIKALDFIDMVAWFEALLPDKFFIDDLKVDNILNLGVLDAKILLQVYKEQFLPWITQWMKLAEVIIEDKKDE